MRLRRHILFVRVPRAGQVATTAIAAALLAGCAAPARSGAEMPFAAAPAASRLDTLIVAPQYRGGAARTLDWLDSQATPATHQHGYVFTTDYERSRVDRWKILNTPHGSAPSKWYSVQTEPQGVGESSGSLWIANTNASDILALDSSGKLTRRLRDPGEFPVNVALTSKKQLYIANIFTKSFGAGDVAYYANYDHAGSKPTGSLRNDTFYQVIGIAADSTGDVFVSNNQQDFSQGEVVEFAAGSGSGTVLSNVLVSVAGGLAIDPKTQDLLVVDQSGSKAHISVYAPPYTGSAIKNYSVQQAVDITLDAKGANLYCANTSGFIDVYGYPSGSFEGSYAHVVEPIGVAVQPPS